MNASRKVSSRCSPKRCHPYRHPCNEYISVRVPMGCSVLRLSSTPYKGDRLLLPLYMYNLPSSSVKNAGSHPPMLKESTKGFQIFALGSVLIQIVNCFVYVEPNTIIVSPIIPIAGATISSFPAFHGRKNFRDTKVQFSISGLCQ